MEKGHWVGRKRVAVNPAVASTIKLFWSSRTGPQGANHWEAVLNNQGKEPGTNRMKTCGAKRWMRVPSQDDVRLHSDLFLMNQQLK